jgi:hypothetical protein
VIPLFEGVPLLSRERLEDKEGGGDNLFPERGNNGSSSVSLAGSSMLCNEPLSALERCVRNLETGVVALDASLPRSFLCVREELDNLWKEIKAIKLVMPLPGQPQPSSSTPSFQARFHGPSPASSPSLSPANFQTLMRQVVDELRSAGFVTQEELQTSASTAPDPNVMDHISGLSSRIGNVERHFTDPDGTLAKIEGRVTALEDRRAGESIEQGGKTFRDIGAVAAWVHTFGDKDLFRYCVDMVTLAMRCADPYQTIAEGMANAASAYKAEYNGFTEARISLSYGLTYPENVIKKQEKEKYAAMGGWYWTSTWSSYSVFKGTFNNGVKDTFANLLVEVSRMIQNAIDFAFPVATHPIPHCIFTKQLLLARSQASGWLDALEPLYEILVSLGMSTKEAWEQVFIFTKAVFNDVRTVRALVLDKGNIAGMIWGSFRTTKLLEEYQRLKFYQHPHVSNMLALTSMQREGKKVKKALATLGTLSKSVESHHSKIGLLEKDVKALKSTK